MPRQRQDVLSPLSQRRQMAVRTGNTMIEIQAEVSRASSPLRSRLVARPAGTLPSARYCSPLAYTCLPGPLAAVPPAARAEARHFIEKERSSVRQRKDSIRAACALVNEPRSCPKNSLPQAQARPWCNPGSPALLCQAGIECVNQTGDQLLAVPLSPVISSGVLEKRATSTACLNTAPHEALFPTRFSWTTLAAMIPQCLQSFQPRQNAGRRIVAFLINTTRSLAQPRKAAKRCRQCPPGAGTRR